MLPEDARNDVGAAGTSIHMRPSIPKAVKRKDMVVAGALFIRRRGAAAAAAEGATRDAQHELGGARVGRARREASEIIVQMLTRQAAIGRRMPCPRAGSSWVASRHSRPTSRIPIDQRSVRPPDKSFCVFATNVM